MRTQEKALQFLLRVIFFLAAEEQLLLRRTWSDLVFSFLLCIIYLIVNFILVSQALYLFFSHSKPVSSCTTFCDPNRTILLLFCTVWTSKVTLLLFPSSQELFFFPYMPNQILFFLFSTSTRSTKLLVCYPAILSRTQPQGKNILSVFYLQINTYFRTAQKVSFLMTFIQIHSGLQFFTSEAQFSHCCYKAFIC